MDNVINIYKRYYIIYIWLFLFFLISTYNSFPAFHDAFLQIFMLVIGWIIGYSIILTNGQNLFLKILIFQILCLFLKVSINKMFYGDFVGPNAIDALVYRDAGEMYGHWEYSRFFQDVLQNDKDYDDWGFLSVIWFCYNSFGAGGYFLLQFLNVIAITLTACRLYKLSRHFLEKKFSLLLVAIWGVMPFPIETAAGFLKENFFSLIVVSAFFYLYKYIDSKKTHFFVLAILWAIAASFFRMALGYAIFLSIISAFFINSNFLKKHLLSVAIFTVIPLIIIVPLLITFLLSKRGITMEALLFVRTEGLVGVVVDYLAGFFGPFPKFIGDAETVQYMTFSSFSSLVKTFISPFFWFELLCILKNGKTRYIPMVIFILCNLFMLVISHFAIQLRFQWPHMAIFLLLALQGFYDFNRNRRVKNIYIIYCILILIVIYKYNTGI